MTMVAAVGFQLHPNGHHHIFFEPCQGLSYICTLKVLFMLRNVCPVKIQLILQCNPKMDEG